eukprot:gene487-915_t
MVKDGCGTEGLDTLTDVNEVVGISLDILNDLLSYEKLEAGIMVIEPIKFIASLLIADFMRPFVMQARRLEVDLQLPAEDSETSFLLRDTVLYADKNRLGQVLRNLVSNALKFTPRNGVIQVQACRISDSIVHKDGSNSGIQDLLRISIVDSGAGISKTTEADMEKLISIDNIPENDIEDKDDIPIISSGQQENGLTSMLSGKFNVQKTLRRQGESFRQNVGDKVLLWVPQIKVSNSKSLTRKWSGPFVITSVIGNLSYRIQYGTRGPTVVNAKRLKAYHPPTKWT